MCSPGRVSKRRHSARRAANYYMIYSFTGAHALYYQEGSV